MKLRKQALANFHKIKCSSKIDNFQDLLINLIHKNHKVKYSPEIEIIYQKLEPCFQIESHNSILHNDPQIGNLLKVDDSVLLIDFEFSCYGNIAIDINNVFFESMTDYNIDSVLKTERGYDKDMQKKFILSYIKYSDLEIDYDIFIKQIRQIENLSHFLWYLWGREYLFKYGNVSDCFDYSTFTKCRLSMIQLENMDDTIKRLLDEIDLLKWK